MGLMDFLGMGDDFGNDAWNIDLSNSDEGYEWINPDEAAIDYGADLLSTDWDMYDTQDEYETTWDWMTQDEGDWFSDIEIPDEMELGLGDEDEGFLSKVPDGVWGKLLDFGLGGLGEWLKQRNAPKPRKGGGGGGGGSKAPVSAVKTSVPVGTREKK